MEASHNQLGESREIKDERESKEYAAMYEAVLKECQAAGRNYSLIMVCAEAKRRLRNKNGNS